MSIDPSQTYLQLGRDGSVASIVGGESFWQMAQAELERIGQEWLITEFECSQDWPTWEMHPQGDEIVYLLSGAATMLLEDDRGVETISLEGRAAVIIPQGTWHTAKISTPSRMLVVTLGQGTQHRPV